MYVNILVGLVRKIVPHDHEHLIERSISTKHVVENITEHPIISKKPLRKKKRMNLSSIILIRYNVCENVA